MTHLLVVTRLKRQDEAGALPELVDSGGAGAGWATDGGVDEDGAVDVGSDGDGGSAGR